MVYCIIIRGPLGCGKSTIAEALAKKLKAKHIAIDNVLDENNIEEWENGYVALRSFLKANEISAGRAKKDLEQGTPVIFDGNFYFKKQIEDLIRRLKFPHYIFTLKAPLEVCIARDSQRKTSFGKEAAEAVHKKVAEFDYGINIDVTQPLDKIVKEIRGYIA
jgi:adenylate kinase family enzyme